MILTCPECATRYSVADDSVGPEGRTVRCAECGLTWRAEPVAALELHAEPEPEPARRAAAVAAEDLPRAFRERIAAQQQGRRKARSGLIWSAAASAAVALCLGLTLGRDGVVQAWPKTASAYAALGLPVNSVGLVIEEQAAQVGWVEGRPAVMVTGRLRNVRREPVESPPLRFTLLDGEEHSLGTRISRVENAEVPAGGSRRFSVMLENPPETVEDVEIGFHLAAESEGHGGSSPGRTHAAKEPAEPAGAKSASDTHDEPAHH